FFNEFVVEVNDLDRRFQAALNSGLIPGVRLSKFGGSRNELLLAFTEVHSRSDIESLALALRGSN
ncbi:MAG TPA: glycine dehydrogenase, partial [Oligoflexia bacterium]|nr:glycine dehydrogenase [Oligoflexia bacterium]